MPCAVSGRRKTVEPSSWTGPIVVWNIRLNARGSVRSPPQTGHLTVSGSSPRASASSWSVSSRKRRLHLPRHWTSGSEKPARCPEASHVFGCWMIAESSATTSSRSWIIAFHHRSETLRLSSTP